jgi:hypothetical protein
MHNTSKYKGVHCHVKTGKWHATVHLKGHKQKYGGCFNDEIDAAKRVNQLCDELKIPLKNHGISMPDQQLQVPVKKKASQFKGITYDKQNDKWIVRLQLKGKLMYGGRFNDEVDAAKKVNEICIAFEMPPHNPEITGMPHQSYQARQKTSQYKGVNYDKQRCKWYARLHLKGGKQKYGGYFENEMDAAKKVNELCEEIGIPPSNPGIIKIPNQPYEHGDTKTINSKSENSIIDAEITKSTGDETRKNEHKRKRKKDFIDNHVQQYYFYDHLLK